MILSGNDLYRYMRRGELIIEPLDVAQIRENGIDLIVDTCKFYCLNVGTHISTDTITPGNAYLIATREHIKMPNDLMAFVNVRSTWARHGFFLPPTIVDAGFEGQLTLEIMYMGSKTISICGERFGHLIFSQLSSPAIPYAGKYQHQSGVTLPRLDKDYGKEI